MSRLQRIRELKTCVYRGTTRKTKVKIQAGGCKSGPLYEKVFFCENPKDRRQVTFRHTGTSIKSCMSCQIGKFKQ